MEIEESNPSSTQAKLHPYLSPLAVWALAFGCAVGWGAFVMPGTVFLPIAGPLGVAVGMSIGALVMLVIGLNYHYMMNRCPDAGGTYAFAKRVFGYDHGFMGAWFLLLVFIAITWANATALPLVFRNLLGGVFQVGVHYQIAGFDVYLGEVLLSLSAIWVFGIVCMRGGRVAALVQTVMAVILLGGVSIGFGAALVEHGTDILRVAPSFAPDTSPVLGILGVVVLAPWAFAGFESISNSTEEFRFSPRKAFGIMAAAIAAAAFAYIALSLVAVSSMPKMYGTWPFYLNDLDNLSGLAALPVFHAVRILLGDTGLLILGITIVAGVVTGLVGNTIGASRLIYSMARDNLLPGWFARLNGTGTPRNAILFILLLSLPIPFLGRTAISWIVDVNTIGATIAYAYTSAVAYRKASLEGNSLMRMTGLVGCILSILFFLYFMVPGPWSVGALSAESYLILILWSVLGFVFFRYIFQRDAERRFGQSTVAWIALLSLIFLTSMLWMRQSTQDATRHVLENLNSYYVEEMIDHEVTLNATEKFDAAFYLQKQMDIVSASLTEHNLLQIVLIAVSLFIMLNIYNLLARREQVLKVQKIAAEQSNKAKSIFFFNMSHDIRTPMNAIIGYVELARRIRGLCDTCPKKNCEHCVPEKLEDFMGKIDAASQHLLSLINDILEMSRIENGKMELEITETNIAETVEEVYDLFATQMEAKGLIYTVNAEKVRDPWVMCDGHRLNRILLNLVSNSYKFTPKGGRIDVTLRQTGEADGKGSYELRVRDTGIGMTPEFAATVFDAYTRDRGVSNIQGTGLGMSITKSIVDLMGGTIEVETEQGKGTEFIIRADFAITRDRAERDRAERDRAERDRAERDRAERDLDFKGMRVLLVEDIDMNREIATMILTEAGFAVDTAENGKAAVEKVAASRPGDYRLILMDIQMPVMNGYEASRAIRELSDPQLSSIPIVAMTANAFAEDVRDAEAAGMNAHVAKPLDVPKMMETLMKVLRETHNT